MSSSGGSVRTGAICFVLLTLQNSSLGLLMRYSRHALKEDYLVTTSVLLCELLKFAVAILMVSRSVQFDYKRTMSKFREITAASMPMAIPAGSYCLQNLLAFVAIARLEPATFSVINQLKILTSAIFARIMLRRQVSWARWRALLLLLIGVLLVQREPCPSVVNTLTPISALGGSSGGASPAPLPSVLHIHSMGDRALGVCAALFVALASGYAGIYFEKHIKGSSNDVENLWKKNFQLSVWGIIFNFAMMIGTDWEPLSRQGFFHGYSWISWLTVFLSAFGGIMVALVVQHADTIVKGFATSFAIILTALGSWLFFSFELSFHFSLGVLVVIIASFNYNQPEPPAHASPSAPSTPQQLQHAHANTPTSASSVPLLPLPASTDHPKDRRAVL